MLNDVRCTRLANGVRVITSAMPRVESVALGIWVKAGSRYEPEPMAGISHFLEHLLFKGTRRRSARDISRAIEGRGGYLNAFTQEELTCYYARASYDQMGTAGDVLADMFMDPRLAPGDIEKERGVIIEEIMMYRDQPQHVVHELLGEAMWKRHPLGRPVIGTPESLKAMTRARIGAYKRRHYVPCNTLFAFAGKVDHDRCAAVAARLMGRLRACPAPSARRVTDAVAQEPVSLLARDVEQTHLALGFRLFGRHDERRYALRVLNVVLGENMSSRLFQVVREKHGLAYSIHSGCQLYADSGGLSVGAGLDRKRFARAQDLIVRELRRLKDEPVGPRELKQAKDYVVGQLRLSLESTSNQMMWLGDNIMAYGRFIAPGETIERILAVSAADVQALAREIFTPPRASLAMVAPGLGDADRARAREVVAAV